MKNEQNMKGLMKQKTETTQNSSGPEKVKKQEAIRELEQLSKEMTVGLIKQCDLLLLLYILKTTTTQEHAKSISELKEQLDILLPPLQSDYSASSDQSDTYFPERTIRRKFDFFSLLRDLDDDTIAQINKLLPIVYGGQVDYRSADGIEFGKNTRGKGTQKRYFFEPVLTSGDMDLIYGALQSSRYLSEEEKNYLLARLRVLSPGYRYEKDPLTDNPYRNVAEVDELPQRPAKEKKAHLPVDSSSLLQHIQLIHSAIESEYQIEVLYGIYDMDSQTGKVDFHPRNEGKTYILNPYAMIWNDGEYYLIATHGGFQNPVHFRVDRIISVGIHTKRQKDGTLVEQKRARVPKQLQQFYRRKAGSLPVFDGILYANTYPAMKYYQEPRTVDCSFECTKASLQILVDYFGTNLHVRESDLPHDSASKQQEKESYLRATVCNVQYENALGFALSHLGQVTLLSPESMVEEVTVKLSEYLEQYRNL